MLSSSESAKAAQDVDRSEQPVDSPEPPEDKSGLHSAKVGDSVVFFDGVCGLCNRFVNFVLPRDRHARIRFSPLQGTLAKDLVSEADRLNLNTVVYWNGSIGYRKSAAIVRVLWKLGGVWRVIAAVLWCVPWPIRDVGYLLISKFRYRLFGQLETCRIPTPGERSRFLD
ncbi:MAG: DCC1-like thiol-disulfide oxidoreductase family protein [Planctomycetota bacterium]|nr:DCC1-like thiol-disulfide oxidoreductase family protein [Planctomycetota bacterium]